MTYYLCQLDPTTGAVFRADGTEHFGTKIVMSHADWVARDRPTAVYMDVITE